MSPSNTIFCEIAT